MGYLYIMEAKPNLVKIGVAEHSVEERQRTVQTGCPYKIGRVWQSRNIPDYREIEILLHQRFHKERTNGEWFEVSFFEAAEEADRMCKRGSSEIELQEAKEEIEKLKRRMETMYSFDEIERALMILLDMARKDKEGTR